MAWLVQGGGQWQSGSLFRARQMCPSHFQMQSQFNRLPICIFYSASCFCIDSLRIIMQMYDSCGILCNLLLSPWPGRQCLS